MTTELTFRDGQCYLAMDESLGGFPTPWSAFKAAELLAMDDGENRSFDRDGRMHVKTSNISKANVCEYFGREIPKNEELGLDPNKKYKLLRDPDELRKAVPTFNNLPILAQHVPVSADNHQSHLIIGTTGTDAKFEPPYVTNSTAFWASGAIGAIQTELARDLSSSYHFRADMTPGVYEGEAYDGVMRDIVGNHVALVRKGRAGDDVVVGDSKPEELCMTKLVLSRTALFAAGAVQALVAPKLAMDAKVDVSNWFDGVSAKNFVTMRPKVAERARASLKTVKLAADASVEDIVALVDALEQPEVLEGADADPTSGLPMSAEVMKTAAMDEDEEGEKKKRDFLKEKLGEDGLKAYDEMCAGKPAKDASPDAPEGTAKKDDKAMITKPAMDAAIESAVTLVKANVKATRDAELAVEPYVGKLALAFDSAEQVYQTAFGMLNVDVAGVHASAFPAILKTLPKPGTKPAPTLLAMDSASTKGFNDRFPNAARIGQA